VRGFSPRKASPPHPNPVPRVQGRGGFLDSLLEAYCGFEMTTNAELVDAAGVGKRPGVIGEK
jgi:hypothetical protein